MTNDDRSNEDRTGDGQAPSWGGAPQQPAHDAPRYGERVDPAPASTPQYGEQAPRYGEQAPQADAPRWGDHDQQGEPRRGDTPQYGSTQYGSTQYGQPQHGHDQYGQQPYAAAPASAGAPSWQGYEEPKAKKKTVGVVAFLLGLIALALGIVGGYFFGSAIVDSRAFEDMIQNGGSTTDPQAFDDVTSSPTILISGVIAVIGSVLGIWAIVQGIIAIVTKRGRAWGVFGLILAVLGPIAFFVTYGAVAAVSVANSGVAP